jgi:ATPase family AAA domain-containing protein 3A/B
VQPTLNPTRPNPHDSQVTAMAAAAKAAAVAVSAGAAFVLSSERAHADGGSSTFRFPGFYSSAPAPAPPPAAPPHQQPPPPSGGQREEAPEEAPKVSTQHPRTSAAGFDPAPLERGVEAIDKLKQSSDPKKVDFRGSFSSVLLFISFYGRF